MFLLSKWRPLRLCLASFFGSGWKLIFLNNHNNQNNQNHQNHQNHPQPKQLANRVMGLLIAIQPLSRHSQKQKTHRSSSVKQMLYRETNFFYKTVDSDSIKSVRFYVFRGHMTSAAVKSSRFFLEHSRRH